MTKPRASCIMVASQTLAKVKSIKTGAEAEEPRPNRDRNLPMQYLKSGFRIDTITVRV